MITWKLTKIGETDGVSSFFSFFSKTARFTSDRDFWLTLVPVYSRGAQMSQRVRFEGAEMDASYFAGVSFQMVSKLVPAAACCGLDFPESLQWRRGTMPTQRSSVCLQILWQEVKKQFHHHQKQQGHRDVSVWLILC